MHPHSSVTRACQALMVSDASAAQQPAAAALQAMLQHIRQARQQQQKHIRRQQRFDKLTSKRALSQQQ